MDPLQSIKNIWFPTKIDNSSVFRQPVGSPDMKKNLSYYISPLQFTRIRHDIDSWRQAMAEAELAWFPHRVRMQRMYQDTILNEHVKACIKKRKRLTLQRKINIVGPDDQPDEELTRIFQATWFTNFQSYALDAILFGYSLISLGDIVNDAFPKITIIRRQNISPDRLNVVPWPGLIEGENFMDAPYKDWHIWVPTPSDLGVSPCGYGMLYEIAKSEILLRNNTAYNADAIQIFGQPIRKGKTTKTEESERGEFAAALHNMGSSAWIMLDDGQDELELLESKSSGTGYLIYGDFEGRLEKKISKIVLGHADAIDSTPGKLGSGQDPDKSPVQEALNEVQNEDGAFLEPILNDQLLPRMRKLGFNIPLDRRLKYSNDKELELGRKNEDESNLVTASIAETMSKGGLKMDPRYFQDRTGIPTSDAPQPAPMAGLMKLGDKKDLPAGLSEKTKNKLKKIYRLK